jgi:hypothetical protein
MIARYLRSGGRVPPPDAESLEIADDGTFVMWRSVHSPLVGRFEGRLEGDSLRVLEQEVAAAAAAGPLQRHPVPDAARESIEAGGALATLGHPDRVDGPWAPVVIRLRSLLDALVGHPLAALELTVSRDARSARLAHRGERPLRADLSDLSVRAVLWGRDYVKLDDWRSDATSGGPHEVTTDRGWTYPLPFDHGFAVGTDSVIHVYASFVLIEDASRIGVLAVRAPGLP